MGAAVAFCGSVATPSLSLRPLSLLLVLVTRFFIVCLWSARAQTQYFETLPYRDPTQCERNQCLSLRLDYCLDHLEGFYRLEKGCTGGQICTNCVYGNASNKVPNYCYCENPPYAIEVSYGQECNAGKVCGPGQGECYRPCYDYLHSTMCPDSHCKWDTATLTCMDRPVAATMAQWVEAEYADTVLEQVTTIVADTPPSVFPIDFTAFRGAAEGYRLQGELLENIMPLETIFLNLDNNNDGMLMAPEYGALPQLLVAVDQTVAQRLAQQAAATATTTIAPTARRLQSASSTNVTGFGPTPETCGSTRPRTYYCSFDVSCKADCKECGWKSATDETFSTCVRPSPERCRAQGPPPGMVYCPSDDSCHPMGDCSNCVDRPIVDHSQSKCLALWWNHTPLTRWTNWVCRFRRKNGMPCIHDQDCIYGLRRCISGMCRPKQPYNAEHICESDYDCPHIGYYCPRDPTGGDNPYWIQYCRNQRDEGQTCSEDRECKPQLRCNKAEPQPRCRRLFSLPIGALAGFDELCELGWRGKDNKCAYPAKSKEAGRSCDSDRDCKTTDQTGRTGNCVCKSWWDKDEAKYCDPVAGDYANHQEKWRDYLWYRSTNCGTFYTEEECLDIFGNAALSLKLKMECETQELVGGPFLPPGDCGIVDEERYPDPCARLNAIQR